MVAVATEAFRNRPELQVLSPVQPLDVTASPVAVVPHEALAPLLALPPISQVPRYLDTVFDSDKDRVSYASDVGDRRTPPVAAITVFGIPNPDVPLSRNPGLSSGMFTYEGDEGRATHIGVVFHDVAAASRYMLRLRKTNRRRLTSHVSLIDVSLGEDSVVIAHQGSGDTVQSASFGEPVQLSKSLGVQVLRDGDTVQVNRLALSSRYPEGRPTLTIRAPQQVGKDLPFMIAWDQELQRRAQNAPSQMDSDEISTQEAQSYDIPRGRFIEIVRQYPASIQ